MLAYGHSWRIIEYMRAYGHEPVLLPRSPVSEPVLARRGRHGRRRWLIISLAIIFLGVACSVVVIGRRDDALPTPIPQHITNTAAFSLYAPSWLPPGAAIDVGSFDANPQVVTFSVTQDGVPLLAVTQQPLPPANNLKDFYQQQLTGTKELPSDAGVVTRGVFEGSLLAGVATAKTWILIRAAAGIDQSEFDQVVTSLRAVQ